MSASAPRGSDRGGAVPSARAGAAVGASPTPSLLLWRPYWDGHEVFNLHVHSKKLWRYSSLSAAAPAPTGSNTPSNSPTPSTTPSVGAEQY